MDSRAGRSEDTHSLNLQAHVGVSLPAFPGFDGGTPCPRRCYQQVSTSSGTLYCPIGAYLGHAGHNGWTGAGGFGGTGGTGGAAGCGSNGGPSTPPSSVRRSGRHSRSKGSPSWQKRRPSMST
jgi:hypothetical protein